MKKINIITTIGIGIILIFISSLIMFSDKTEQPISQEEIGVSQENVKKEIVLLVIDDSEGTPRTFEVEFNEEATAFDLLRDKAEELDIFLKIKNYDFGILIEAIGDKENGQDGKYWLYYVNGEMPMISADQQAIESGDKIEFKFEKSAF
ncbi:DUF4430 domain-containing protein [Patescibacteria group bacterium]|nr:DUF4430 domain-containing protein [Patescibacteria group bacterium]